MFPALPESRVFPVSVAPFGFGLVTDTFAVQIALALVEFVKSLD